MTNAYVYPQSDRLSSTKQLQFLPMKFKLVPDLIKVFDVLL